MSGECQVFRRKRQCEAARCSHADRRRASLVAVTITANRYCPERRGSAGVGRLAGLWHSLKFNACPPCDIHLLFSYTVSVWDPFVQMPRVNRTLVDQGACIIAGLRLAKEKQVNTSVVFTRLAIEESVDLAHEIYNRVFRRVPERMDSELAA